MWNKIIVFFGLFLTLKTLKALECEVGRNKPTSHTSTDTSDTHPSNMSVDGDFNTYSWSNGFNRTTWLRIDLGQEYMITRIVLSNIYSSSTFNNQWLKSFNIEVSNREVSHLDNSESYYWTFNFIPQSLTIKNTKRGRYVYVYKNGNNYKEPLTIAEINIYAELILASIKAFSECEVASGKSASQISTLEDRQAKDAIDGQLYTYSKTDYSSNNINTWLQVDLFQNYLVVKVVLSNINFNTDDKAYLRNFAIFVRQTNETTDKVGNVFGSNYKDIAAYEANQASQSIIFIKADGEIGRFVTVVKEGSTFTEPLVIADLAVFANLDFLPTISTTKTTTKTSKMTSGSVISPINNATGDDLIPQMTNSLSDLQPKLQRQETEKIVIGVVVGLLAFIAGVILGSVCVYKFFKKSNAIPATYETTKIQNTDPHVYAGIDNTALQQIDHYDNEKKL